MRCHDVLGVRENATADVIYRAYDQRVQTLEKATDILPVEGYIQKQNELITAKQECLEWLSKSSQDKVQERIALDKSNKNQIRLYSPGICIGPCTCWDKICGSPCMEIYGTQSCPITCDVLIYIGTAIMCLISMGPEIRASAERREKAKKEATQKAQREREARERGTRRKNAEDARQKNTVLRQQLGECQANKENIKKLFEEAIQTRKDLEGYISLFNSLGVADQSVIRANHEVRIKGLSATLDEFLQQEKNLLTKIEQNQATLDAELHDNQ